MATAGSNVSLAENSPADGAQIDDLAVELRTLLGLRTRTSARDRPLPTLTSLLPPSAQLDPDARFAATTALLEAGIAAMPDADHSTAADALLGSGPGRWRPLSARGLDAAQPFGCGWDAYRRRRRSTDTSLLEETVDLLARTIVEIVPDISAPDEADPGESATITPIGDQPAPIVTIGPTPQPAVAQSPAPDTRTGVAHPGAAPSTPERRPRALIAVAVVATLALIGVAAALAISLLSDDDGATDPSCGSLDNQVGAVPAGAEAEVAGWSKPFVDFVSSEGIGDLTSCASDIALWEHGAIQRVGGSDPNNITALIGSEVSGEMVVVHLGSSELRAFARITNPNGPDGGSQLGETLGPVLGRDVGPDGERLVEFDDGLFVTEPTDAPTFAIAGAWVDIWNEHGGLGGGLGLPLSDRRLDPATNELFQQFERGTITTTAGGQIQVAVDQDHYANALPTDTRNRVLVDSLTQQWWYVDAEGVRHYAATPENRSCLERQMGVPIVRNQPVAAIATLPAGDQFLCQ